VYIKWIRCDLDMILVHHTDSDFMADTCGRVFDPSTKNPRVSRLWDEVFLPYVYVSCYDKPENIRYCFLPRLCFLWRCCAIERFVKRFVGGWVD
jgi:hypothetical protein